MMLEVDATKKLLFWKEARCKHFYKSNRRVGMRKFAYDREFGRIGGSSKGEVCEWCKCMSLMFFDCGDKKSRENM